MFSTKLISMSAARCVFLLLAVQTMMAMVGLAGDIIPPERRITWQGRVGVPGGIPANRAVFVTLQPGADSAAIQAAVNACPSNHVVQLSAGSYNLNRTITLKDGVTLRGAGMNNTKLLSSGVNPAIYVRSYFAYDWNVGGQAYNRVSWVGNYSQSESNLLLQATNWNCGATLVPVGRLVFLDQLNDTNTSAIGACGVNTGAYTSRGHPGTGADRYQNQLTRVIAVNNGTNVTIWPPVFMANYAASLSPTMWWESSNPIQAAGVEDVHIAVTNRDAYAVSFENAYACWMKNVKATACRRGMSVVIGLNLEARGCWFEGASGSTDDYPFGIYLCSASLFEDNIVHASDNGFVLMACSGNVFAYNYGTNFLSSSFMHAGFAFHGGHPSMNLLEGNWFPMVAMDNCWGSSIMQTVFRNRLTGWDECYPSNAYSNYRQAIHLAATNRFMNIVGNVLGTEGLNWSYENAHEQGRIYLSGNFNNAGGGWDLPVVTNSALRHGNWSSAIDAGLTGIVWDSSIAETNLPRSLYLTGKPPYFGILNWPPVDPNQVAYSVSRTNIPAGYRFIFGTNPPPVVGGPPVRSRLSGPTNVEIRSVTFQ